jgi:hypothetical protein
MIIIGFLAGFVCGAFCADLAPSVRRIPRTTSRAIRFLIKEGNLALICSRIAAFLLPCRG